jgi:hypothetical protein
MRSRLFRFKIAVIFLVLFVFGNTGLFAQDKSVERIKRIYDEIGKRIELSEKGIEESQYAGIFCAELSVNKNKHVWPVVGNYEMTYKFYYDLAHTEGHQYPDRLRKVVMKSSMSDRSYYSEYLFDEAGVLVFYFTKPNEPPIGNEPRRLEQGIYFERGKPIRLISAGTVKELVTAKDLEMAKGIATDSARIKSLFALSLELPND